MGLDVSLNKVVSIGNRDPQAIEDVFTLEEFPKFKIFKDYIFTKRNSYYDIETVLKVMGYDPDKLEWSGTEYGEDMITKFKDPQHELFPAWKFLDSVWHKLYMDTEEELYSTPEFKEFEKDYLPILIKHGYKPEYSFFASKKWHFNLNSAWKFAEKEVSLEVKNPPTIPKLEKCITAEEIGYQRKGANSKFYDDGMWDSEPILDKDVVIEHWKKYFSDDDYSVKNFKEQIVDKFVEGETFLLYC
jgi:predicted AlkP superfamily phosphohydrolase/phosphomutase